MIFQLLLDFDQNEQKDPSRETLYIKEPQLRLKPSVETDQVWVGEEHKARSAVDDLVNGCLLYVGHVAEDGEHEDPGDEAGHGVDDASDDRVPDR